MLLTNQNISLPAFKELVVKKLVEEKEETTRDLERVQAEIDLKTTEKQEAAKRGDLSENAEYHAAVEALGPLEKQRAQLRELDAAYRSNIFTTLTDRTPHKYVDTGAVVRIKSNDGREYMWMITPSVFASLDKDTLSDNSPVGSHLLGLNSGSDFEITIKGKLLKYTLQEVY